MINLKTFFDSVRPSLFGGKLLHGQVLGMETILAKYEDSGINDLRKLAYILATVFHETATTMEAIEEYGKGRGKPYGKKIKHSGKPYTNPNKIYYGRGLVQLSWFENYQRMGELLGYDLLNHPELACDLNVAVDILFEGMMKGESSFGDFTGVSLEDFFNDKKTDWENARKIINGRDKAKLIASYALKFYAALQ